MKQKPPIAHWSHSSLTAFLRNPLAWYKRYVEGVQDMPASPSSFVGRAAHVCLEHFYNGIPKEVAMLLGLQYLRDIQDVEINFGTAKTKKAKKRKRAQIEHGYTQAVSFYLERPPRHKVLGVEIRAMAEVPGLALPVKAVSDLVVRSRVDSNAVDIIDLNFDDCKEEFILFHRLINDATEEISRQRKYLPNPSDMFEGENSFDIYRLGLVGEDEPDLDTKRNPEYN